LAASGRVERVQLPVVGTDGARSEQPVLRVGSFSAFTDEAFLRYDADAGELLVPTRQPSGQGLIEDYLSSSDALATLPVDPSRGTLIAQLQRQPDLWDRVKQGGLVGGVILVLGAVGLLLAIWRMV
ncbi:MotA/TolQ/ExbB proton channel family protein, partial [Klebsiella pneumoniae]